MCIFVYYALHMPPPPFPFPLHLPNTLSICFQGANFSCVSGWLRVWGNIQALSAHQKALIIQTSHMSPSSAQRDVCSAPSTDRYTGTGERLLGWNMPAPLQKKNKTQQLQVATVTLPSKSKQHANQLTQCANSLLAAVKIQPNWPHRAVWWMRRAFLLQAGRSVVEPESCITIMIIVTISACKKSLNVDPKNTRCWFKLHTRIYLWTLLVCLDFTDWD